MNKVVNSDRVAKSSVRVRPPLLAALLVAVSAFLSGAAAADASPAPNRLEEGPTPRAVMTITDDETGDERFLNVSPSQVTMDKSGSATETTVTAEAVIYVDENGDVVDVVPAGDPSLIQPLSTTSTGYDAVGISATLNVTYNRGGTSGNPTIRVTRIAGSWSVSGGMVLQNRIVAARIGANFLSQQSLTQHPTSYSFAYRTGWGYVPYMPATGSWASPDSRVWSGCQFRLSGTGPNAPWVPLNLEITL